MSLWFGCLFFFFFFSVSSRLAKWRSNEQPKIRQHKTKLQISATTNPKKKNDVERRCCWEPFNFLFTCSLLFVAMERYVRLLGGANMFMYPFLMLCKYIFLFLNLLNPIFGATSTSFFWNFSFVFNAESFSRHWGCSYFDDYSIIIRKMLKWLYAIYTWSERERELLPFCNGRRSFSFRSRRWLNLDILGPFISILNGPLTFADYISNESPCYFFLLLFSPFLFVPVVILNHFGTIVQLVSWIASCWTMVSSHVQLWLVGESQHQHKESSLFHIIMIPTMFFFIFWLSGTDFF